MYHLLPLLNKTLFKHLLHKDSSLNTLLLVELTHQLLDQNSSIYQPLTEIN